jgi:hypothetical protein
MTTILSIQITVNETKVSPARVTEEMVKGFVFLREGYFGLSEPDLSLDISTITVTKPKRERLSRKAEKPDPEAPNREYIGANPEPDGDPAIACPVCGTGLVPKVVGLTTEGEETDLWCSQCEDFPDMDSGRRYPDYPSIRVGSKHEEEPLNGRSWCAACGFVDELDLIKDRAAITQWHGDSFGLF